MPILAKNKDIQTLMASLSKYEVYTKKAGRVLDADEMPAPDVLSVGLTALSHGTTTNPLAEFNAQFNSLCEQCLLTLVSTLLQNLKSPVQSPHSTFTVVMADPNTTMADDNESAEIIPPESSEDELEGVYNEDWFAESPTLTCHNETDIALDMDSKEWLSDDDEEDILESRDAGSEMFHVCLFYKWPLMPTLLNFYTDHTVLKKFSAISAKKQVGLIQFYIL
jgi:hypothetical protein